MKLFGLEIRKAQKQVEKRELEYYTPEMEALLFGSYRTNYSAMNLSAVFRCVDLISDSVAMLPIKVVNNTTKHIKEQTEHPLNLVFSDGLNNLNKFEFIKILIQSVLLKGNGFALIQLDDYIPLSYTADEYDAIINDCQRKTDVFRWATAKPFGKPSRGLRL